MTPPPPANAPRRPMLILAVLVLASSAYLFTSVMVIPAFGDIARELDVAPTTVAWLLTAPLIVGAISPAVLGRFGDMFGKARLLVVALAVFAVGGAIAGIGALQDSTAILIAGRALQGVGAAAFPLSFGIVRDEFPAERVPGALALLSASFGIGAGIGLVVAGPIIDTLSWDWLFWIGSLVVVVALAGAIAFVPESPVRTPARIDWPGAMLLATGLVALLIAISKADGWGWDSGRVIGLGLAGIVVLAAWLRWERHAPEPLVDLEILRTPAALATNLEGFAVGFAQFATMAILPLLVATPARFGFGFDAGVTDAGLFLLPATIAMILMAPFAGVLGKRHGPRAALATGALLLAAALLWLAASHGHRWELYAATAVFGAGLGLALAALATLVVQSVEPSKTGVAAGINAVSRTVGGALGSQVATTVVAGTTIAGTPLPAESGYTIAFIVCAAVSAVAVVTAALVRRQPPVPAAVTAHT
jgi:MFS family permease